MNVSWERSGKLLLALVEGRLDTNSVQACENELVAGIGEGDHNVVLDFERLSYINSAGLRVVLKIAKKFTGSDKNFGICSVTGAVKEIFAISGLESSIKMYGSKVEAIGELGND